MCQMLLGRSYKKVKVGASISHGERRLLDSIPEKFATTAMPPGTLPNPSKKKVRPSSASANLQTHESYYSGLYDSNARPTTAQPTASAGPGGAPAPLALQRPKTQAGGPRFWGGRTAHETATQQLKPQRRLTVTCVDGLADTEAGSRPGATHAPLGDLLKGKIEEKISIETLEELKKAFELADVDGSGKLDLDEFKRLVKHQLNIPPAKEGQIDALFQKIDWSSEGLITWDEFCTYMQLEYAEKEDSYLRAREVAFHLPAKIKNMPHREPVLRITDTSDGTFMACSQDGLVTFWTPGIELKRQRSVVPPEMSNRTKPKWITDFTLMPHYNKIIVGTGDREIQFFELSSFEPYCQINSLESVPLKLDYCSTGHDECLVLFGDGMGVINILVINSAGECLRTWKKAPKAEGIASIGIDQIAVGHNTRFIRWKVHGDWVQQLKYYPDIRQVISCCNHANTALVIGCTIGSTHVEQQLREIKDPQASAERKQKNALSWLQAKPRLEADQSVFKVYKGVKVFAFSKDKNIIVTGGMDRIVRMWNPYVPSKPTGMLRGHSAPIFYLFIAEDENRIFSISTDKCIKIWDIQDQNCLLTVRPKMHKIRGDLQACHYSNMTKTLAAATDQMNALPLRLKPIQHADIPITHKEPIHSVVYNPSFKQVITCSDGSVVKLWDFETGNAIFEFGEAHGEHAITCMTFDSTARRLLTGGRDGCIRIWNYNNGHCLRTMMKDDKNEEVCSITYVEMNKNRYVVAVGWDKRINIYTDSQEDTIHHVQRPQEKWSDDLLTGHKEDILSVAQCPPNLLATSSYDGEVIVWNMVSGHIFCHLVAPMPDTHMDQQMDGDLSINKVVFLKTRAYSKDSASLVSSGPRGHIHFWNVFQGGSLMAQFCGAKFEGTMLTAMEVNKTNTLMFSADHQGFVCVWNIDGYCLNQAESAGPELLTTWRGHIESVTCVTLIEEQKKLITSSLDCTVRLWSFEGEYIGTFGQPEPWDIYNQSTFQHPMVPYDVLVDPLSLPSHPVLADKHNVQELIHEDSARNSDDEGEQCSASPTVQYGKQQHFVDDHTIADMLKEKPFNKGTGKRLRHEKRMNDVMQRMGPYLSEFHKLSCHPMEATPTRGDMRSLRGQLSGVNEYSSNIYAGDDSTRYLTHMPSLIMLQVHKQPPGGGTVRYCLPLPTAGLRHEKLKPVKVDRGGPSEYQMLRCYDLDATPQPASPKHLRRNNDDPFHLHNEEHVDLD